ncbi:MAG: RidA family protein [Sphingomonadaceae bacterium]|nr:RidA family protein [Sphingomonadaceae bacterium]
MKSVIAALLLLAAPAAAQAPAPATTPQRAPAELPFSEARRAGDLLFLSGALGRAPGGDTVVSGGIVPETEQTLRNIETTLKAHGGTLDDVVKCTVFLADMAEWPAMNQVYVKFFKKPFPARSALGASGLALGARVEIECIAHLPKG